METMLKKEAREVWVDETQKEWLHSVGLFFNGVSPRGGSALDTRQSVFVASIGNQWEPGCWEAVVDMLLYTKDHGPDVGFREIVSVQRAFPRYDPIEMRNEAILRALEDGVTSICMVDNDVKPEPDLLMRLLAHRRSVVAPLIMEKGHPIGASGQGQGLEPCGWTVFSFLLFSTMVFNTSTRFEGTTEGLIFRTLAHYGHELWVDTNSELKLTRGATRPGAKTYEENLEKEKWWYNKMLEIPDRGATDQDSPYLVNGMYVPFLFEEISTEILE
jgi:hypothetical protein